MNTDAILTHELQKTSEEKLLTTTPRRDRTATDHLPTSIGQLCRAPGFFTEISNHRFPYHWVIRLSRLITNLESAWRRYQTLVLSARPMPIGRPCWPRKSWQTGTQLLTSVFHASVLLLIMNFVMTLSK